MTTTTTILFLTVSKALVGPGSINASLWWCWWPFFVSYCFQGWFILSKKKHLPADICLHE